MMGSFSRQWCAYAFVALASCGPILAHAEAPAAPSPVVIDASSIDAGTVFPLAVIEASGMVTNTSNRPVKIARIIPRVAASRDEIQFEPKLLQPGQTLPVRVKASLGDHIGRFSLVYFAFADGQVEPVAKLAVRGFVDWIVDPVSTRFDAGVVKAGETVRHEFRPSIRSGVDLKLTSAEEIGGAFKASVAADGRSVIVELKQGMPWGPFDESVVIRTNNIEQGKVPFRISGEVRGAVVPNPASVDFGVIREGQTAEQIVRLTDESSRPLRVGEVSVAGADAQVRIEPCIPAAESCRLARIVMNGGKIGSAGLRGTINVVLPDYEQALPIAFRGALIGKDTVVQDLDKLIEGSRSSPEKISAMLKSSTSPSPRPPEMPKPDGVGPLLTWEAAGEAEVYGYEIYRAASENGVFERVNADIIKRLSNAQEVGSIYRWRDMSVASGTYWYYIGIVKLNGEKKPLNSPQRVLVKQ
ncbi:MAG: hypothetical protein J0L88_03975 [Xanthomonadales bacterium]|nr:hypothetical protein [Xanthomonadales bacterium]